MKKLTLKLKKLTGVDWFYIIGFAAAVGFLYIAMVSVL